VAALVDGDPVAVEDVDAKVASLRAGPRAGALPHPGTPEERNLRRWVVQLLVGERLVETAVRSLGRSDVGANRDEAERGEPLTLTRALEAGGVGAALLATSSNARALRRSMEPQCCVDEVVKRDYYDRNLDRYAHPPRFWISRIDGDDVVDLGGFGPRELPLAIAGAVLAANPGDVVGPLGTRWGRWTLRVDKIEAAGLILYAQAAPTIDAELNHHAATRAFCAWLDTAMAGRVQLMPGYEHPADPRSPDATHRH
jgi:[acyl-carrier-protein] S-malonyltransferase